MATIEIMTNRHWRPVLYWHELTPKEQKEFDYLDSDDERESAMFMRYRGNVYDLGEFMRVPHGVDEFKHWDGYAGDSYFSGTLIRFNSGGCKVQAARYYS